MTAGGEGSDRTIAERIQQSVDVLRNGAETERTVFFSDAVFAIAMTLLVLDLKLPAFSGSVDAAAFNEAVAGKVNGFLGFVLSFVLIGSTWLNHHRKFKGIVRYDPRLQLLNLGLLFFVALCPSPPLCSSRRAADRGFRWRSTPPPTQPCSSC